MFFYSDFNVFEIYLILWFFPGMAASIPKSFNDVWEPGKNLINEYKQPISKYSLLISLQLFLNDPFSSASLRKTIKSGSTTNRTTRQRLWLTAIRERPSNLTTFTLVSIMYLGQFSGVQKRNSAAMEAFQCDDERSQAKNANKILQVCRSQNRVG